MSSISPRSLETWRQPITCRFFDSWGPFSLHTADHPTGWAKILRGLEFPHAHVLRPRYFGVLRNDIIYKRITPGVLGELKRVQRRDDSGRAKDKLFQRLTTNVGQPKLREHLGSVVTLMKLSNDWAHSRNKLDKIHPHFGDTIMLPFEDGDTGTGL